MAETREQMVTELEFDLRDSNPWHVSRQAFDTITSYLQPSNQTSTKATAAQLHKLNPSIRQLDDGEAAESTTSFLLEFWETFVIVAKQTPHDHQAQEGLVDLVQELKALPADSDELESSIWAHLEGLENVLQEAWGAPSEAEDSFRPFGDWINLNSFAARLFGASIIEWYYFAVWTLRGTFEETGAQQKDVRENRVLAAAQWILHAGPALIKIFRNNAVGAAEERVLRPIASSAFGVDRALSYERWLFWCESFQDFSQSDTSENTKKVAVSVVKAMADLEGEETEEVVEEEHESCE